MSYLFLIVVFLAGPASAAPFTYGGPPASYNSVQVQLADAGMHRLSESWRKAHPVIQGEGVSCLMVPKKAAFFCKTDDDKNNFFCVAHSSFGASELRKAARGEINLDFDGDHDLRIACEGDGWLCEQKQGSVRECWSRAQYDLAYPLGPSQKLREKDHACANLSQAAEWLVRYAPGTTPEEKLQYLADTKKTRPLGLFVWNFCEYSRKSRQQ